MLLELCLCVVILKTRFFMQRPTSHLWHFTNAFCHTPGLTHATPQLHLRRDRPMFAAADFEPSDLRFNIRWST